MLFYQLDWNSGPHALNMNDVHWTKPHKILNIFYIPQIHCILSGCGMVVCNSNFSFFRGRYWAWDEEIWWFQSFVFSGLSQDINPVIFLFVISLKMPPGMRKLPNQRSQLYMTQEGDVERGSAHKEASTSGDPVGSCCGQKWGCDRKTLVEKHRQMREEGAGKRSLCS